MPRIENRESILCNNARPNIQNACLIDDDVLSREVGLKSKESYHCFFASPSLYLHLLACLHGLAVPTKIRERIDKLPATHDDDTPSAPVERNDVENHRM